MKQHRIDQRCPACTSICTAATGLEQDEPPNPGDFTVCIFCGTLLKFEEGLALRTIADWELDVLPAETRALLLSARISFQASKNKGPNDN